MLSLEKAKEFYAKGGEFRDLALGAYTEEELVKIDLPKTWVDFCNRFPIKCGEAFVGRTSTSVKLDFGAPRRPLSDRNILPSVNAADAHLAMMQLHQLRDCYRHGWKPSFGRKAYAIYREGSVFGICESCTDNNFLSFPTMELACHFLDRFKHLMHLAGDLI